MEDNWLVLRFGQVACWFSFWSLVNRPAGFSGRNGFTVQEQVFGQAGFSGSDWFSGQEQVFGQAGFSGCDWFSGQEQVFGRAGFSGWKQVFRRAKPVFPAGA